MVSLPQISVLTGFGPVDRTRGTDNKSFVDRRCHVPQRLRQTCDHARLYTDRVRPAREEVSQLLWASDDRLHEPVSTRFCASAFGVAVHSLHSCRNRLGVDVLFPVMQYGRQWREHRRAFHHSFAIDRIVRHEPVQVNAARRFLVRLLTSPENAAEHLKQ